MQKAKRFPWVNLHVGKYCLKQNARFHKMEAIVEVACAGINCIINYSALFCLLLPHAVVCEVRAVVEVLNFPSSFELYTLGKAWHSNTLRIHVNRLESTHNL